MTLQQESELLASDIKLKLSVLKMKGEDISELEEIFQEMKDNGTTIEELRYLYEDLMLLMEE